MIDSQHGAAGPLLRPTATDVAKVESESETHGKTQGWQAPRTRGSQ